MSEIIDDVAEVKAVLLANAADLSFLRANWDKLLLVLVASFLSGFSIGCLFL